MAKKFQKMMAAFLSAVMCMTLVCTTAFAEEVTASANVARIGETEYATLAEAVAAANADTTTEGAVVIELIADTTFNKAMTISRDITITGNDTITRADAYTGTLFTVNAGKILTLDGVIIDGGNDWTLDEATFKADAIAGTTVDGTKTTYHTLEEGAPVATAAMFVINGSVVMNDGATVQNNAGATVFNVKNGGYLETNKATITHNFKAGVEAVATVAAGGKWVINEGTEISKNFSRDGNGGLCRVYGTVIINDGLFTQNAAIGNGSIFMVYTAGSYLEMNKGLFTENYCLNHNNNNWNGVIHVHYTGPTTFVMNGGEISGNYGSYCGGLSASKGGNPANITINGGKIVDNVSALNGRDVTLGQAITVAKNATFGEVKAYRDVTVTAGATMKVLDTLYIWKSGADIAYNGEGTVDGNVDLHNGVVGTMNSGSWLNGMVTVNAIGTGTALVVKPGATIDGTQVRVLDSVASGDYLNAEEAAAAQAASYVEEDGAIVKSPVLFYHRLTSAQKTGAVITYDYNGGLDAQNWSGCQIVGTANVPAPTKDGYKLVGWAYADDNNSESLSMAGDVAYAGEEITSNVRLIAQWKSAYVCYIEETGVYYETLTAAVADANKLAGANTIVMIEDIDFDSTKALSISGELTIVGDHTISRGAYTGTFFTVSANATLTLDDGLVLDGDNEWTFDSEGYYADMAAGLTLSTGAKNSYTTSNGTKSTAPMISIAAKGAVVMNNATIQNIWADNHNGGAAFKIPANATLTMNDGALIKHLRSSVVGQVSGVWTMNGGKIEDIFGHSSNGGVVDLRNSGTWTINGGEITDVKTLGLNANGNGILVQAYGESSKVYLNGGWIHDNASFAPGGGWGAVMYMNRGGDFTMTGGTIEKTKSDHCSAFVANTPTQIELLGGTIEIDPSTAASFDSLIYGNTNIAEGMKIVGTKDAFFCVLGDKTYTLNIDGEVSGGTMWLMHNQPVTGDGTITSDVLVKADPSYFEFDGKVIMADANWLNSLITVDSVGSDASLTVEPAVVIDGVQVRVLGSVPSAEHTNIAEAAAEQAAAYIEKAGATVKSPVLYYHRLTSDQKSNIVVTYDYNGGLDASGWSGAQVTSAESFVPGAPAPTKAGYVLAGWAYAVDNNPECLTMESGAAYNGEAITQSVRLIAQWTEKQMTGDYIITYDNKEDSGKAYMLYVTADGEVVDFIEMKGKHSPIIVYGREDYISVVYIPKANTGWLWTSEEISDEIYDVIEATLDKKVSSYKEIGADATGLGEFELTKKKQTYTYNVDLYEAPAVEIVVKGATESARKTIDGVTAIYIAADGKIPAVIWASEKLDAEALIAEFGADSDTKVIFGLGEHEIEYQHNKNKTKTVTYTFSEK